MKKSYLKSVILIALFSIIGCSSDSAEEEIICAPPTCFNGGVSNSDCGCDCPEGFTGADCWEQKTPIKVLVTKIRVISFPDRNLNDNFWDSVIGMPDIYVTLSNTQLLYISDFYPEVANGSNPYDFTPKTPIELTKVSDLHTIQLNDYDNSSFTPNAYENMGSVFFVPYLKPSTFSKSIIVKNEKINLKIEIFLTYVFK